MSGAGSWLDMTVLCGGDRVTMRGERNVMSGRTAPARVTVAVALVMLASSLGLGCGVERAEPSAVGDPPAASPASAAELELPKAVGDLSFQDGSTTQFPPTEADRSSNRADSERLRAASEVSENSGFPAVAADLARLLPKVEQVEGDFTISQDDSGAGALCLDRGGEEPAYFICGRPFITFDGDMVRRDPGTSAARTARLSVDYVRDEDVVGVVSYRAVSVRYLGEASAAPAWCESRLVPSKGTSAVISDPAGAATATSNAIPTYELLGQARRVGAVPPEWTISDAGTGSGPTNIVTGFVVAPEVAQSIADATGLPVVVRSMGPC